MDVDTQEFASRLVGQHGLDTAIEMATEAIARCNQRNDLYRLSVWREIRRNLRARKAEREQAN